VGTSSDPFGSPFWMKVSDRWTIIPGSTWWLDPEKRTVLSRGQIRDAMNTADESLKTKDYSVDLGKPEDVSRFCRMLIEVASRASGGNAVVGASPAALVPAALALAAARTTSGDGYTPMRAEMVTEDKREEIVKKLNGWADYATKPSEGRLRVNSAKRAERNSLGMQCYAAEDRTVRDEIKAYSAATEHLRAAVTECKSVAESLTDPKNLSCFAALYRGDVLQGVIEWSQPHFIANIVGNPENIVPMPGAHRPSGASRPRC
jgi:hypothetical protein